jgi:hypothetical protein
MKTKTIPFAEFRRFLQGLGYREKRTDAAEIFYRTDDDMFVFRLYRDDEPIAPRDLHQARMFLDFRGYLAAADFDAFVERATTPAQRGRK